MQLNEHLLFFLTAIVLFREVILQRTIIQTVTAGTSVVIPCGLNERVESPYWRINETIYTFAQVPLDFELLGYAGILISEVSLDLNDTTFQCVGFDITRSNVKVEEIITVLRVLFGIVGGDGDNATFGNATIFFDYDRFSIIPPNVFLSYNSTGCGPNTTYRFNTFFYNGNTLMVTVNSTIESNDTTFEIPSSNNLLYLLVAVDANGTDCSNLNSYYQFSLESINISVHAPGDDVCVLIFPSNMAPCDFPRLAWPGYKGYCHCVPIDQRCIDKCRTPFVPVINNTLNQVCFQNATPDINNMVFTYECNRDLCDMPDTTCDVTTVIYAEKIIIPGPPDLPNVTSMDEYICFSAYSHPNFPINSFSVDVRDVVGVASAISGRYNTSQCITIPLPACGPFDVEITAANDIGISDTAFHKHGASQGRNDCACFNQQDQFNLTFSVSTSSATVEGNCTSSDDFNITVEDADSKVVGSSIFTCNTSREFDNLLPSTNYSVTARYRNSSCVLATFSTEDMNPGQPGQDIRPILIGVLAAVTVVAVIIIVVIITFLIFFKPRKKSKDISKPI